MDGSVGQLYGTVVYFTVQRVYMCHGQNGVAFAADLYENTALFGLDRLVAEAIVFLTEIIRYFFRETGRTVDSQQGFRLF